ncbi:MAG: TGS domain-containing protein, partial [Candidatus Gastranaerophilales bacterium]|nr:TGS domain-containing protein [Candidatus Gastranaerophilales bacterium]
MIKVVLPDGSNIEVEDKANVADVALKISEGLKRNAIAGMINNEVVDLYAKIKDGDNVRILTAKDKESLSVLRHSCSHIMAQAVQNLFPQAKLAIGPSIENGFYYDFDIPEYTLSVDDLPKIEEEMKKIIKED